MTIRNRGLRTDRHQDSKEDRGRWEPVLTEMELVAEMAARMEIRKQTSHLEVALRTLRAKSATASTTTNSHKKVQGRRLNFVSGWTDLG